MGLAGDEVGVARHLDHLDQAVVRRDTRYHEACVHELLTELVVHLVAVAVALVDHGVAVDLRGQRALDDLARIGAEAHRAAFIVHILLLGHEVDDGKLQRIGKLRAGRPGHPGHVARELAHGRLQPQAYAEEGHLALARMACRVYLALESALAKTAGHEYAVEAPQLLARRRGVARGHFLAVHQMHVHVHPVCHAGMAQRLDHGEVRIGQPHVLAHDGDVDLAVAGGRRVQVGLPIREVRVARVKTQAAQNQLVEVLVVQAQGDFVDAGRVLAGEDPAGVHVAKHRNLVAQGVRYLVVGAQDEEIRLDADGLQLLHRVLRGLGLQLVGRRDVGHEGAVDEGDVLRAALLAKLARGLEEGLRLDVAHRAAYLGDDDVGRRLLGDAAYALLDGVGDVRNDLHGAAEEIAAALLGDEALIDGALRDVALAREALVDEALVVAEIQVAFKAVVGDEDLAVLEGTHRARVDVEVGIHLLHRDLVAAAFQQLPQRRGRDALAQRGYDAAGHEDVFRHE